MRNLLPDTEPRGLPVGVRLPRPLRMMEIKNGEMQLGDFQVSSMLVTVCLEPCQGIVGHQ